MKCPRCQFETQSDAEFCPECGAKLAVVCAQCATANAPGHKFCKKCGQPLVQADGASPVVPTKFGSPQSFIPKHLAEKILTSKSALEGERKQVTVLFADLKGSMELLADRDPEEARKLLDPVLEHMMEAVHCYEGTVNQIMGDGIMALFGAPLAHEDHAVRACYAALRMQDAVDHYSEAIQRFQGIPVMIRVGLNSGEVVVGSVGNDLRMDYTAVGQTTHLAARMEQMAKPGSIMVSNDTHKLTEGFFQYTGLGPVQVKGMSEPIRAYELDGVGRLRTRLDVAAQQGLVKFVGRQSELEVLRKASEQTHAGRGQVVAVVGEAGVGKSRLFREFTQSHGMQDWLILNAGAVSYSKATDYLPVIDLLKGYFQIDDRDDQRKIREKLMAQLLTLGEPPEQTLPALLTLLDVPFTDAQWMALEPLQRRRKTLNATNSLFLWQSQKQPLCLIVQDLHWIDFETQAFLDSLIEHLPTNRLLLLVNYRPEYQHGWENNTCYTQLSVAPFHAESSRELLQNLLGTDVSLNPLKQILIKQTEGNPFFLEESVQILVETKALTGERGAYRMAKDLPTIHVPPTLQAVLAARIDRLSSEEKHILQSASVIGENVPFSLLQSIIEMPDEQLRRSLGQLQVSEFLYETSLFPEREYKFKHALTYQVAYNSLLMERRRTLHALIVDVVESNYADRLAEHVERLAHHAFRAELWQKATLYLHRAGTKAAARSAYHEAQLHLEQALTAVTHLPETKENLKQALDIRIELGAVLIAVEGPAASEVMSSYAIARNLCERVGDASQLFPVLWNLSQAHARRGEWKEGRKIGEQLLSVAERAHDNALLLEAHHTLWAILVGLGELVSAEEHLQEGVKLYDPQKHKHHASLYGGHDPGVCCRIHASRLLWLRGYSDQALKRSRDTVKLAQELTHPYSTVYALENSAWIHHHRGERHAAKDQAIAATALATEQGFPSFVARGKILLGRLLVEGGEGREGIEQMRQYLTRLRQDRMHPAALMAESYGKEGQIQNGLDQIVETIALMEKTSRRSNKSELYRIKGELMLSDVNPAPKEAATCFRHAVDTAHKQDAKSLELRATMSMARLLHQQDRTDEARQMLREIYGWFTEGFDTADLKEARALL